MNTTISFIYVHRNKDSYSYCNNLDTNWPFQEHAWKGLKKDLKECYSYAILNESFKSNSASGHNYKPVAILAELDSLEEAKEINYEYFSTYMKIHNEDLSHLGTMDLQEFTDTFCLQLVEWMEHKKQCKKERSEEIFDAFHEFKMIDFFDVIDPLEESFFK